MSNNNSTPTEEDRNPFIFPNGFSLHNQPQQTAAASVEPVQSQHNAFNRFHTHSNSRQPSAHPTPATPTIGPSGRTTAPRHALSFNQHDCIDPALRLIDAPNADSYPNGLPSNTLREHVHPLERRSSEAEIHANHVCSSHCARTRVQEAVLYTYSQAGPEYLQNYANSGSKTRNQAAQEWTNHHWGRLAPLGQNNVQQYPSPNRQHGGQLHTHVTTHPHFDSSSIGGGTWQHDSPSDGIEELMGSVGIPIMSQSIHSPQNLNATAQPLWAGRADLPPQHLQSYIPINSSGCNPLDSAPGPLGSPQSANTIGPPVPQVRKSETYQDSPQSRPPSGKHFCAEEKCQRGVKIPNTYCKRHQQKYDRNNAGPPQFPYLGNIDSAEAMRMVYPRFPRLQRNTPDPTLPADDPDQRKRVEDYWVQCFLQAAMEPVDISSPNPSDFERDQQEKFNGKALMESKEGDRYSPEWINARMRMLFQTTLAFHRGGQSVYPVGGDNAGYGKPDTSLNFRERLQTLYKLMTEDKLIVMNVIEARGVLPLVENPARFQKRKTQNKQSNLKKDEVLEAERKRQREATAEVNDESSDDEKNDGGEDETAAGPEPTPAPAKAAGKKGKRQATPGTPKVPQLRRSKRVKTQAEGKSSDQPLTGDGAQATSSDPFFLSHEAGEQDTVGANLLRDRGFAIADTLSMRHPDQINYTGTDSFREQYDTEPQRYESLDFDLDKFDLDKEMNGWL